MPNILYMAISKDGFIAGPNGETPWSDAEWEAYNAFVLSCDIVLVGRKTYEILSQDDDFVAGPHYIVVTDDKHFDAHELVTASIRSKHDMPKAERLGIIGGGELSGRLAKLDVIDEIILDIEPIELKDGIRLFGKHDIPLKLELLESKLLGEDTIQRHYRVIR